LKCVLFIARSAADTDHCPVAPLHVATFAVTVMKFVGFGVASDAVSVKYEPFEPDCTVNAVPELVTALVMVHPPAGPVKL
jgi:hypothetical protein